jgi:hypothetical protein
MLKVGDFMGGTYEHIFMWVLSIIVFLVSLKMTGKNLKIMMMINRVLYILIIATGIMMLMNVSNINGEYIAKTIIGVWVIAAMEMTNVKRSKGKNHKSFLIQFWIAFVLVLLLGFRLPFGIQLFG